MNFNSEYLAKREAAELQMAEHAVSPAAAAVHRELAAQYQQQIVQFTATEMDDLQASI